MPAPELYFAFPEGSLQYVCEECDALCCRGQGFAGSLKREMGPLLQIYPTLGAFATDRRGDEVTFTTPAGRCFFLQDDRLCRIHLEHGLALKPAVCRAFPFNRLVRIGTTVAVAPHFMCPLRLVSPARPEEVESAYDRVAWNLRESGLLAAPEALSGAERPRLPAGVTARAAVAREVQLRERCAAALGRGTFRSVLEAAAADPAAFRAAPPRVLSLLGCAEPAGEPDEIDAVLLAIAPALRLSLLPLPADGMLLALAAAEGLVRSAGSLSGRTPTPQAAWSIAAGAMPLLLLLGRGDAPVGLRPGSRPPRLPPFGGARSALAAYTFLRLGAGPAGTLELLERAAEETGDLVERTVLLRRLGEIVERTRPRRAGGKA